MIHPDSAFSRGLSPTPRPPRLRPPSCFPPRSLLSELSPHATHPRTHTHCPLPHLLSLISVSCVPVSSLPFSILSLQHPSSPSRLASCTSTHETLRLGDETILSRSRRAATRNPGESCDNRPLRRASTNLCEIRAEMQDPGVSTEHAFFRIGCAHSQCSQRSSPCGKAFAKITMPYLERTTNLRDSRRKRKTEGGVQGVQSTAARALSSSPSCSLLFRLSLVPQSKLFVSLPHQTPSRHPLQRFLSHDPRDVHCFTVLHCYRPDTTLPVVCLPLPLSPSRSIHYQHCLLLDVFLTHPG